MSLAVGSARLLPNPAWPEILIAATSPDRTATSGRSNTGRARPLAPRLGTLDFGAAPGGSRSVLQKVVADLPYFDSRTRIFKLFFDFCGLFLVDAFLDRLWRRLDEVLGFLEAELGQRSHFFDHIDFFLADRGQDDIKLGLFGNGLGDRRRSGGRRDRRRGRYTPFLLEHLCQLCRFDHGQRLQIVDEFSQLSHVATPDYALKACARNSRRGLAGSTSIVRAVGRSE